MYCLHQVFLLPFSKSSNAPKSSLSAGYPCKTTFTSNAGRAPRGGSKLATANPNSRGYEADAASICLIPTLQLANKLGKLAFEISNYFKAMGYSLFQGNRNWGGISILQRCQAIQEHVKYKGFNHPTGPLGPVLKSPPKVLLVLSRVEFNGSYFFTKSSTTPPTKTRMLARSSSLFAILVDVLFDQMHHVSAGAGPETLGFIKAKMDQVHALCVQDHNYYPSCIIFPLS